MFNDAPLRFTERIPEKHRIGFDSIDLSESANETRSTQMDAIEREIMGLKVGFGGRKISQMAMTNFRVLLIDQAHRGGKVIFL
jgi:hypothetical protein